MICMVEQKVKVCVSSGIHFRPAGKITEKALEFSSNIRLETERGQANVKSFFSLLAAGIRFGDDVTLICEGDDEKEALEAISQLLTK